MYMIDSLLGLKTKNNCLREREREREEEGEGEREKEREREIEHQK